MASSSFYDDRKFCHECEEYVPYLMSTDHSYCVKCGAEVRLFSKEDWVSSPPTSSNRRRRRAGALRRTAKPPNASLVQPLDALRLD